MKKHVLTGKNILKETIDNYSLKESFLETGMNICAYHHEKFNGKGYPEGLKGREIPLVADKNQHFDPDIVEAFLECEEKLVAIT